MTIWLDGSRWQSKLYDKKAELVMKGLKINKYPHPKSMITTKCKYGVITSQLHRFQQICTKTKYFINAAVGLYSAFLKKGYRERKVDAHFEKFIMRNYARGNTYLHPKAVKKSYQTQMTKQEEQHMVDAAPSSLE